jgi:hypothetical protein
MEPPPSFASAAQYLTSFSKWKFVLGFLEFEVLVFLGVQPLLQLLDRYHGLWRL